MLNAVTNFDWITPSWMILQDFWNRPVSKFGILANAGFDRGDIRRILRGKGVRSWGYIYNVAGDMIMLSVPKAKAAWAYYLLQQGGRPYPVRAGCGDGAAGKEAQPVRWVIGMVKESEADE